MSQDQFKQASSGLTRNNVIKISRTPNVPAVNGSTRNDLVKRQ